MEPIRLAYIQADDEFSEWPTQGEIAFVDVGISWNTAEENPLLDRINLRIGAGEKFGIRGRTGSGKSTLGLSPLRLNEIVSSMEKILPLSKRRQLNLLSSSQIIDVLQSHSIAGPELAVLFGQRSAEEEQSSASG
ncbi:hypothetical protein N7495_000583 [Penicillium taxi]|uniref:uncharacterized protein n=1 Tax=Penicillium taxi TaxID=168475 RepID=UPI002545AA07|nr:uncharacterized protein N7495_000583 [Penicillium taxi]KAJ5907901.1 hypothetical protein N7495_000583 [Penicillium taxi]